MLRRIQMLLILLLLTTGSSQLIAAEGGDDDAPDLSHAVIVVVDTSKITRRQIIGMGRFLFHRLYPKRALETLRPDEEESLSDQAMREVIIMHLIENDAKARDVDDVPAKEVDDHAKYLGISFDDDETREIARRWVRSKILFNIVMAKSGKGPVIIRPIDIKKFYFKHKQDLFVTKRMVKVRHIYLPADQNAELAKREAAFIFKTLKKKRSDQLDDFFAQAAKEFSQGRFKQNGGMLLISGDPDGWFPQNVEPKHQDGSSIYPEALNKGIRSLIRPGQLSDIIQSEQGFHILYLVDAKDGRQMPLRDAQMLIKRHLEEAEHRDRMEGWLRKRLERTHIVWHDGKPYPHEAILPENKGGTRSLEETRAAAEQASSSAP